MAPHDDKQAFAERLKLALTRSRKKITTPTELAIQFNLHYVGSPVSPQAVQKWMVGQNRPNPDKIDALARFLNVSAQWLRYGIPEAPPSASRRAPAKATSKPGTLSASEAQLITQLRALPEHQQALVIDVVQQFALQQEMWLD